MTELLFPTTPMAHQATEVEEAIHLKARAEWWDPGTGKTLPLLQQAAILARAGEIDGVLVLAPKGVHTNWVLHEAPKHLHQDQLPLRFAWSTERSNTVGHREMEAAALAATDAPLVAMSYDAAMTETGTKFCQAYLKGHRRMLVCDESHRIKTPGAKRTKRVLAMATHAAYVRVATGTPVDNSPFDAYTQVKVLDPNAWRRLGIQNSAAFRSFFGVWEEGFNRQQGRAFKALKGYRNMDALQEVLLRFGRRIRVQDVLDLPPLLRSRVYHEMTPAQRKIYDDLRENLRAILPDQSEATCLLKVVLLTRLRQVACGYLPGDDDRQLRRIVEPTASPRICALHEALEDEPGQALIWCCRDQDVDDVLSSFALAVRYDGRDSDEAREEALRLFRSGAVRFLVGKPAVGGIGITLTEATTVVYYSSDFNLTDRRQSEARAHRMGQTRPVRVVDICAEKSIDEYILAKLSAKKQVSADLLGDPDVDLI